MEVANQAGVELDVLSQVCSSTVLVDLAELCEDWQLIARRLKLTKGDIRAIDVDKLTEAVKRVAILEKWKESFATKANYKTFIEVLLAAGKTEQAIKAAKIIRAGNDVWRRVYTKERRVSYSSIVPCTAVVRIKATSMIIQHVLFSQFTQLPTV